VTTKLKHQRRYFDKLAISYHKLLGKNLGSAVRLKRVTKEYIFGDVLDIGSGGIISYDLSQTKKLTLADIAPETLKQPLKLEGRKFIPVIKQNIVTAEANVLELPFDKNSFDTVMMITTAHHLSEESLTQTKTNIQKSFDQINKVLKNDGVFIIHECFLHPILKLAQEVLFECTFAILEKIGKPLPYFISEKQLKNYLKGSGFRIIKKCDIRSDKRVFISLFSLLSPPGWLWDILQPSKVYICKKLITK